MEPPPLPGRELPTIRCMPKLMFKRNQTFASHILSFIDISNADTVDLQWLVYHGCFELVLESQGSYPVAADLRQLSVFFFLY